MPQIPPEVQRNLTRISRKEVRKPGTKECTTVQRETRVKRIHQQEAPREAVTPWTAGEAGMSAKQKRKTKGSDGLKRSEGNTFHTSFGNRPTVCERSQKKRAVFEVKSKRRFCRMGARGSHAVG